MWDPTTIGTTVGGVIGVLGAVGLTLNRMGFLYIKKPNGVEKRTATNEANEAYGGLERRKYNPYNDPECCRELELKLDELAHNQISTNKTLTAYGIKLDKLNEGTAYMRGLLEHFRQRQQ